MSVGRGQGDIAQAGRFEAVGILQPVAFAHAAHIARNGVKAAGAPRAKGGQADGMKGLIGEKRTGMAAGAGGLAKEERHPPRSGRRQGGTALLVGVKGAVKALPFGVHEGAQSVADMDDRDILRRAHILKSSGEQRAVFRDDPHPFGDNRPGGINAVMYRACDLILARIPGHFELRDHGKEALGGGETVEAVWQPFFGRRVEAIAIDRADRKAAIVKKRVARGMPDVPQPRRVTRDAFADAAFTGPCGARGANAEPAFADPKAQPIGAAVIVVMTGPAGNVAIAAEDFVIEKQLPQSCLLRINWHKLIGRQRVWQRKLQRICQDSAAHCRKHQTMRKILIALTFLAAPVFVSPAFAEIEEARDLMEQGRFEEAREAFWPAARSGNADAEELIGVMYALGLGVEQDYERAFEWYLRSAMKGHPGAQSGVGWYYEVGLGMPAPDLMRAYMWYVLSAIGGDPDAAISQEEVVKKMTQEQIDKAHVLIDDYRVWMYPFR